jgi:hypothetical protein
MSEAKRFPTLIYVVVLGLIVLIALAPVLSVVVSSAIANAAGCALDEGGSHPCVIGGKDWSEALYTMFVLGWFMLLTLPAGALAFAVWTVTLVLHRGSWRRRQSAAAGPPPLPN